MIRYSNSFFLSLIFHGSLLLSVWFFYNNDTKTEQETPLKIPLKLSMMEAASQTTAQHQAKEEVCIVQPQESKPKRAEEKKERVKDEKIVEKKIEKREEEKRELKREEQTSNEAKVQKSVIVAEPQKSVAQEVHKEVASEQKIAPKPQEKSYEQEYYELNTQKIVELLRENLYYPRSARLKEIVGVVKVKFMLDVDAKVHNITVIESSNEILSRAAIKTIEELSTKFPKPTSQTTLTIPITYSLTSE